MFFSRLRLDACPSVNILTVKMSRKCNRTFYKIYKSLKYNVRSGLYVFAFIFTLSSVFYWSESNNLRFSILSDRVARLLDSRTAPIRILFWTQYYQQPILQLIPFDLLTDASRSRRVIKCKYISCEFTTDRNLTDDSDALIFHARNLFRAIERNYSQVIPLVKRDNQPWIFFTRESPVHTLLDLSLFPNIFNWTMTYRSDSDIPFPYAKVTPKVSRYGDIPWRDKLRSFHKTKPVAWTVSNCNATSRRDEVVRELHQFIPVDIYGACGNFTCQIPSNFSTHPEGCHEELQLEYKFYLSFENSLCVEYVTEKFFNALDSWMIPVVYGHADYKKIAPPNSFIDIRDFDSIEELGSYLLRLDGNQEEYEQYFEWKDDYEVVDTEYDVWCDICEKVAEGKASGWKNRKWYSDLRKWFSSKVTSQPRKVIQSADELSVEIVPNGEINAEGCVDPPFDLMEEY